MHDTLERHQVWVYLFAILTGLGVGGMIPEHTARWEVLLWPALGVLLYSTFTQVPLLQVALAFRDRRFLAALLAGNFVVVPLIIGLLLWLLPIDDPAIRLGVILVLLVPCTDWFISFTHLGRGDGARAIAATPLLLLAQLALLPVYLWLFMGDLASEFSPGSHLFPAFLGLIVVPLALAWVTEWWAKRQQRVKRLVHDFRWLPVPLLALVVFLIASSQVNLVLNNGALLWWPLVAFLAYLLAAALAGKALTRLLRLPAAAGRTLVFSLGTRNSFVMLPLALALPGEWRAAVVVIVFQSLVELFGMVLFLRWVPGQLIRDNR